MKKRMLIMILWGFPFCFCGGTEFPEFTVDDYGSVLVGSPEHPVPVEPPKEYWDWFGIPYMIEYAAWSSSEGGKDYNRIQNDPNWPSYVDPDYWEEFLNEYREYYEYVYNYFEGNIPYPPEPQPEDPIVIPEDPAMPLSDDIGAVMGMILMGIAYGVFAYRVRR